MDFFNLTFSVHFMCDLDKWRKDMRKMEKMKTNYKKKKTTMADQYIQIFVVWLLLSCSGLY